MSVYAVEQATVYRAGGRRYFSRDAAIRRYARSRFSAKHPCDCEAGDLRERVSGLRLRLSRTMGTRVKHRYVRLIRKALKAGARQEQP